MAYEDRRARIRALERARDSRVLTYVLSDRPTVPPGVPGFQVQIDGQVQWPVKELLRQIGHVPRLDLFLYTRGGSTDAVWPLVSLLREYCDTFAVLVPFRAHSGGTMICLGADEIVMLEESELSPIDPTTGNQFNPIDPANPSNRLGISVEDVAAYFRLATDRADLAAEAYRAEVFKQLVSSVHPLALGNVQRVYLQIRRLAERLLALHLDAQGEAVQIETITKGLTEEFFSHVHAVTRREAIALLGDWVRGPRDDEAVAIRGLFDEYASGELRLGDSYNLPEVIGDEPRMDLTVVGGLLETSELSYRYETKMRIAQRPAFPPGIQVQIQPGAVIPLQPWVSRSFDFGLMSAGWTRGQEAQ